MSDSNKKYVLDLFAKTSSFKHIYEATGFVFLVHDIMDMTAICAPSIRKRADYLRISFELGLMAFNYREKSEERILKYLAEGRYVSLPRVTPIENAQDMIVRDGSVSNWLISEMISLMRKYSMERGPALKLVSEGNDKLIESFKSVYENKFDEYIVAPLCI